MNLFLLTSQLNNELKEHDFLTFIPMTKTCATVEQNEIYAALLNPTTSPYFSTSHNKKTLLQSNGHILSIMFYAYYCGYLYAVIRDCEFYDKDIWTYQYMHLKLAGQIYEPIFISLIPQILDYKVTSNIKDLYLPISLKVFSIVLRYFNGFLLASNTDNFNIFESNRYNTDFYKIELPNWLNQLHKEGTFLFFDAKYQHSRLEGKNLLSKNLWGNLDDLQ